MCQEGHEGDSSGAPRLPPTEKASSAATSASEPDQAPTQAVTPSRATLEGLGYGPWSTAGEEKDGASTDGEALVIDEGAPEDRKTFLESSSFSSTVSSDSHTDEDMPETSETTKKPAAQDTKRGRPDSGDSSGRAQVRRDTLICGLPLPGSASAVVNAYADDITVYVQDCDSLRRVWRIFDAYAAISGAALNFNKCHGISLGQLSLWPSEITRKPTVKILGVWFNANGASRKTWSNVYHAMEAEVEKLERFQVPLFERRHFAHSVLCGPAWYVAQTIPPPRKTALRLQRLLTEFFWNHKTALVAAPVLSLARDQGGVSYPRIRTQARVLAVKGVLQILDDEESPARPLARYFLGTARRSLCKNDRDNCSPSATKPTKFYKDIITMHRLISEQAPEVEVRNVPATRVTEILTCQEIAPNRQARINAFHWTALTAATIPVDVRLGGKHQPIKARSLLFAAHGKCFQVSMAHKPAGASSFSFKVSTAYKQASTSSFFLKGKRFPFQKGSKSCAYIVA
ncbi:hypothetical protein ISCGN_002260 [Ixodes scapularis]